MTLPNNILEKHFPTPEGHTDTEAILAAMEEHASQWKQKHDDLKAQFDDLDNTTAEQSKVMADAYERLHKTYSALQEQHQQLKDRAQKLADALKIVQNWQLPSTGKFWDQEETQPMSYGACYGSNGERDFMRNVANEALQDWNEEEDEQGEEPGFYTSYDND